MSIYRFKDGISQNERCHREKAPQKSLQEHSLSDFSKDSILKQNRCKGKSHKSQLFFFKLALWLLCPISGIAKAGCLSDTRLNCRISFSDCFEILFHIQIMDTIHLYRFASVDHMFPYYLSKCSFCQGTILLVA